MSVVYITENGAMLTAENNRINIKYKNGLLESLPVETVECIILLGKGQLSTQCMETCMTKGIHVSFFSKGGRYFGRLMSTGHVKAELQRKQAALYESQFAIDLSRKIINAKIANQITVLRRYAKSRSICVDEEIFNMQNSRKKVMQVSTISEIMGYEGSAARSYFEGLSYCIESEFRFKGRSKRPPRDEFNSLISLGYSILMNDLYAEIENHGLNPFFGFLHRDAEHHPTLASDLMEEWRAVLVDSLAMSLINGHELHKDDFIFEDDNAGCFLTKQCLIKYVRKLDEKMKTKTRYLNQVDFPVNFRNAIAYQISSLVRSIECVDASLYNPIQIR
ncbi:CRISPR-associated endonuclease Cas1 [[Clostridium] aminophilum]|uniref:CRISPR-associated endonuclease Cas1 n=1 Tax=[Clostridium] aminophilum TaxID=1526 RepID=A0A1I6JKL2_9FIRM|nr:CRISPR-associated endonuclease Cas1 [[Clostridium] aminophilum]SFR79451.1 CRISP-associated protein Cas1 [[Clostridium] aminophilum]